MQLSITKGQLALRIGPFTPVDIEFDEYVIFIRVLGFGLYTGGPATRSWYGKVGIRWLWPGRGTE